MSAKKRITKKVERLENHFRTLRDHPNLNEILNPFYASADSLNNLSEDSILMIATVVGARVLLLPPPQRFKDELMFSHIAKDLKECSDARIREAAEREARRQIRFSLLYSNEDEKGERMASWFLAVGPIGKPRRKVLSFMSKMITELLVARAVHHRDYQSLEGLAALIKESGAENRKGPKAARFLAGLIISNQDYLAAQLERDPTKSEIKQFLTGISDDLSTKDNTWSNAFQLLGWDKKNDRKIKSRNIDLISRLIRSYQGH
ncbi:MAG: hypothetical protein QNL33_18005 [Akkermansiaceae bacterium]|jgi:hypothetical protein